MNIVGRPGKRRRTAGQSRSGLIAVKDTRSHVWSFRYDAGPPSGQRASHVSHSPVQPFLGHRRRCRPRGRGSEMAVCEQKADFSLDRTQPTGKGASARWQVGYRVGKRFRACVDVRVPLWSNGNFGGCPSSLYGRGISREQARCGRGRYCSIQKM